MNGETNEWKGNDSEGTKVSERLASLSYPFLSFLVILFSIHHYPVICLLVGHLFLIHVVDHQKATNEAKGKETRNLET